MKKAISILFLILCLLSALPLINHELSVKANPTAHTWTVDDDGPPANFTKIQDAINYASSGDTIFVHVGTYYENVIINKTITLLGEDRDFTIIDGYETSDVIYVRANNVTVKGFTLRNSAYIHSGILIDSTDNHITNNRAIYNYKGISLAYSSGNVVCDNTILNNKDGIYLLYSSNNVVSNNVILYNDANGIYLQYSGSNVICGNTISSNSRGINLDLSSENNIIYHNNFDNTDQAESESTNVWNDDYPSGGNFWGDHTDVDVKSGPNQNINGSDGIGDTPYTINAFNKDNYPLMGTFSNFSVTVDKETYVVTVISNSTISLFRFQIGEETGNKMMRFNVTGKDGTVGFFRVRFPTKLMNYPHIVLIDGEEITPTLLSVSNETHAYLYFTYLHRNQTITIVSSKTLALYFELLDEYLKLQAELYNLNETYHSLLEDYSILLSNYTQLQIDLGELSYSYQTLSSSYLKLQADLDDLNETYYALSANYDVLLYNHSQLQASFHELNDSYLEHLLDYSALLGNYNILLYNYSQLQNSYLKHLLDYSEQMQNIRNLTYILVALTAILIVTTFYLSKRAHANVTAKIKAIEEK